MRLEFWMIETHDLLVEKIQVYYFSRNRVGYQNIARIQKNVNTFSFKRYFFCVKTSFTVMPILANDIFNSLCQFTFIGNKLISVKE